MKNGNPNRTCNNVVIDKIERTPLYSFSCCKEESQAIINWFPSYLYYDKGDPFDIYVDSTHFLTIIINHSQWEHNTSIIIDMILNVKFNTTLIISRSIKSTNEILTSLFNTYFPNSNKKSILKKEMLMGKWTTGTHGMISTHPFNPNKCLHWIWLSHQVPSHGKVETHSWKS
jgi:hypothetical protein